jgi:hypothetical protein
VLARRHDVRTDVTQCDELVIARDRREATQPASRDVLEEDALDRILRTEVEDLFERRTDEPFVCDVPRL